VVGHLWYGRQDFPSYSQAALGLAVTAILSAFYPAWRAAHFRPTEAMRKV
jgi:ABC-type lipoprotein release transport system permease subunit